MSELKNVRIVSPVGRLAFHKNLFKANDKGRYTMAIVFDTDADTLKALEPMKKLIADLTKEKWADKIPSGLRGPIKKETREEMIEKYPFLANKIVLNATNGFEIPALDTNNQELFEGDLKAGDYVRVSISGYTYDNQTKGVGFNANAVQFIKKGEAFYSRQSASDMFASAPEVEGAEASTGGDSGFDSFGF